MQRIFVFLSVLQMVLLTANAAAFAEPPRVMQAVPDHGDVDVDPALAEIRLEFDQDMSPNGFSICGGGPSFPELRGRPRWETPRLLVLDVQLQPEHTYNFSVNCPAARNTRSANGEAAEVYPISFTTRRAGAGPATPPLTIEQNRRAIELLRAAIDEKYAYRDLRHVDWQKAFDEMSPRLEAAQTPAAFARQAARLLARAKDLHNSVKVGKQFLATHRRSITPNANAEILPTIVPEFRRHQNTVWTGQFADGIGYINILTWGPDDPVQLRNATTKALDAFANAKGVVLDLRFNSGGDELLARRIRGELHNEGGGVFENRYRSANSPNGDGFGPTYERVIKPHPTREPFAGKVAVLMGPANMSSCESFLMMMRTSEQARLFGEQSYGSSGNSKPHDLGNGVTVLLSSWQDLTPAGVLIEGVGITPDEEIETRPRDFRAADPILEAALKWLRD